MKSVFRLRQTNSKVRQIMDVLHQYRLVASHGLTAFCALLRTGLAGRVSLPEFYDALCTKNCSICGEFGGFISLPTWTRCCFGCLREAKETQVRTVSWVQGQLGLPEHVLMRSAFRNLPGHYYGHWTANREWRISLQQAWLLAAQQSQAQEQLPHWINNYWRPRPRQIDNFAASAALPYYDKEKGRAEEGLSCVGCASAWFYSGEWLGSLRARLRARNKVHSEAGFLEHFKWCEYAQRLWESSEDGTRQPDVPWFIRAGRIFYPIEVE
jgi:hypothetical protein